MGLQRARRGRPASSRAAPLPLPARSWLGGLEEGVPLFHFSSVLTPQRETVFSPPTKKKWGGGRGRARELSALRARGFEGGAPPGSPRSSRGSPCSSQGQRPPAPGDPESSGSEPAGNFVLRQQPSSPGHLASWLERPPSGYADGEC